MTIAPDASEMSSNRADRRRQLTRAALIASARELLRRPDYSSVSVAEITSAADVGFGSFYNHFTSKTELFEAAVHDVLAEHTRRLAPLTADVSDPAREVAITLRATFGLVESNPEIAEILAINGMRILDADTALTPRAREIIRRGKALGRFVDVDEEVLLAIVGGALLAALHTWQVDPERADAAWGVELIERLLVTLGIAPAEAKALASTPPNPTAHFEFDGDLRPNRPNQPK